MADSIYIFTVAKQGIFLAISGLFTFSKGFMRRMFVRNNATHVVTSTSNIIQLLTNEALDMM